MGHMSNALNTITIETLDALTALEAMERIAEGYTVEQAIAMALKTKAAADADPWHLEADAGPRLLAEVRAAGERAERVHRIRAR